MTNRYIWKHFVKVDQRIYEHGDGRFEARYRKGRKPDDSMSDAKHMSGMIVPCEVRTVDISGIFCDFVDLDDVTMRGGENYMLTEKRLSHRYRR